MLKTEEKLSAIVIEDDLQAKEALCNMLSETEYFNIVGYASSVKEGIRLFLTTKADVAFCDVELTDGSSFDILDHLKNYTSLPYIIFTTAHDKYAIQAFKYAAFDYLLKPIIKEELLQSIDRLLEKRQSDTNPQRIEDLMGFLKSTNKIKFNTTSGFVLFDPEDIFYIQADNNYCEIYLNHERKEVISLNIGKLEEILPPAIFYRISRSVIINIQYLLKVNTLNRDCVLVKDNNSVTIKASLKRLWAMKKL